LFPPLIIVGIALAEINGIPLELVFDTGANSVVLNNDALQHGEKFIYGEGWKDIEPDTGDNVIENK